MSLRFKTLVRLAVIGLAATAIAACASHPKPSSQTNTQSSSAEPSNQGETREQLPSQPTGPVPGSAQDFVINVGELVYFDFDKFEIRADATPILDGQSAWLRRYPDVRVRIEGNCDERGTREYNFALGARRANSVRDYLIAHGVAAGRIATISYGKERPLDPGSDDQAWARNRNGRTAITDGAR
ncbi:MAG: peptidoglycan-associated lipoprotein Pal [Caulobacterales bacterium]